MRRVATLFALALAIAGCGGSEAMIDGDCLARFSWEGVEYESWAAAGDDVVGERLGAGEIRGCADDPGIPATIHRVRGLEPEVAVAVRESGSTNVRGRAGYIVESARHPFHDAVYRSPDKPDYNADHRCGAPRSMRVRVTGAPVTPEGGKPLQVTAGRPSDEEFLTREDVDGYLYIDPQAKITRAERNGIPFVAVDDRITLTLRECVATADAGPGMVGLRRIVVDELRGAG